MPYIKEAALHFILEASKNFYPREFSGLLRGDRKKELIEEVLVLPATIYGEGFASIHLSSVPIDSTIVGSVHSHPSPSNHPSLQDSIYFRKTGNIHLIAKPPYQSLLDVACYDRESERLDLWMVD